VSGVKLVAIINGELSIICDRSIELSVHRHSRGNKGVLVDFNGQRIVCNAGDELLVQITLFHKVRERLCEGATLLLGIIMFSCVDCNEELTKWEGRVEERSSGIDRVFTE